MLLLLSRLQIFFPCQYLTTILQNDLGICQALSIQNLSTKINLEIKAFHKTVSEHTYINNPFKEINSFANE